MLGSAFAGETRVIDGGTIAERMTTYRLFGIDAPEADQRNGRGRCSAV
jgi:endonuclease YncB( thermonuclease family)